jgi:hypothetical protein
MTSPFPSGLRLAPVIAMLWSAAGTGHARSASPSRDPFAPSATGIAQAREIMGRLGKAMGNIPPDVERIAVYQIKTDPREFSAGMARYIQAQVEETFRKEARKTMITSPELRTYRVVSTDSSFKFTNSVPSMEELWRLGEKLRVDAFLEGSCTKSEDNDVILNLKLFRHKTGEVLWSGSFVAGPNDKQPAIFDLEWSVSANIRPFPIKSGSFVVADPADTSGQAGVLDTLTDLSMNAYGMEVSVSEAVTADRRIVFTVSAGYAFGAISGFDDSLDLTPTPIQIMKFGIEVLGIFFRKPNPDLGYWLGTYAGFQQFIPFQNKGYLSALTVGYKSRVSRHFTLGGGILFMPSGGLLVGVGEDSDRKIKFQPVAYELIFLHYTF